MNEINGLVVLAVLASSIWVAVDASSIGVKKGQMSGLLDMGPGGWFFSCLLLWIICFPLYLTKRGEYKRINSKKLKKKAKSSNKNSNA